MTFDVLQSVTGNIFFLHRPISGFCEKRSVVGRPVCWVWSLHTTTKLYDSLLGNIRLYSEVGGSRGEHEVATTLGHVTPPLPVRFGGAIGRLTLSRAVRWSKGSPWTADAAFSHLERGKKNRVSPVYTYWVVFLGLHWKKGFPGRWTPVPHRFLQSVMRNEINVEVLYDRQLRGIYVSGLICFILSPRLLTFIGQIDMLTHFQILNACRKEIHIIFINNNNSDKITCLTTVLFSIFKYEEWINTMRLKRRTSWRRWFARKQSSEMDSESVLSELMLVHNSFNIEAKQQRNIQLVKMQNSPAKLNSQCTVMRLSTKWITID